MKQGKKILAVLISLALIAGIVGGVILAVRKTSARTIPVYRAGDLNYGGYMYNMESTTEGYVTADAAQNVYPASELAVREILVREGQEVFVGDVLLTYDTDKTKLNLEKAELSRQQIQLQLDVATRNLATLGKLKPVSESSDEDLSEEIYEDEGGDWEVAWIDDEPEENGEEPAGEEAICYDKLTEDSLAYNREDYVEITADDLDPEVTAGMTDEEIEAYLAELSELTRLGTEEKPYRFLCRNGAVIEPSFINHLKKLAEEKGQTFYIQLEVREGDRKSGSLIEAWKMDASRFTTVGKDWSGLVIAEDYITTPSPTPTAVPSGTVTPTAVPTGSVTPTNAPTESITPAADSSGSVTPGEDSSETTGPEVSREPDDSDASGETDGSVTETPAAPTDSVVPEETVAPDETQPDVPDGSGTNTTVPSAADGNAGSTSQKNPSGIAGTGLHGNPAYMGGSGSGTRNNGAGSYSYAAGNITTKYLLTAMGRTESSAKEKSTDSSEIAAMLGLISSDARMSADEIREARKQEEQTIKSLKLDLREAALKLKEAQKAMEDGTARAKMNGVVKSITDPDAALSSGSPIVQVTAAEGLFVRSALPENLYDIVKVGYVVSIISWTSGQSFSGRIRDIAFYPDTSGMFGYGSQTTYYPMTIYISERSEALSDGEWVQVTMNGTGEDADITENDGLYLYRAFIREDGDGKYVLKRGDDGKLVKQYVKTGELSGDGYEILSGVTGSDWLAFPYGRNLTEGLETREGSVDELYAS